MFFKLIIFSICLKVALSWSTGAPTETCETLTPGHGSTLPFDIPVETIPESNVIRAGDLMSLTFRSLNDTVFGDFFFRGFVIQARILDPNLNVPGRVIGSWEATADTHHVECPTLNPNSVLTHSNNDDKAYLTLLWRAPPNIAEEYITFNFYYSIVMNVGLFWPGVSSPIRIENPARFQNTFDNL